MSDVLANDRVRVVVDPTRGARLTSLVLDGHEVLAKAEDSTVDPDIADGIFPMVPWAGRVRGGRLDVDGVVHQLPVDDEGNALHGLGHVAAWASDGPGEYRTTIGAPWPTTGEARLTVVLLDDGVRLTLTWDDGTASPCSIGLHPWFRRRLDDGTALDLAFEPETMVERGTDGLPTGALVAPTPGPWDDCFGASSSPVLTWPGALTVRLTSSTSWWVVYDQPESTVCVEPQTVPPDAFSHPALQPHDGWPHEVSLEIRVLSP